VITVIHDQSGRDNRLTQAPPGGFSGPAPDGVDNLANAVSVPVSVGGHRAYGVFVAPGTGCRNNGATGTATGELDVTYRITAWRRASRPPETNGQDDRAGRAPRPLDAWHDSKVGRQFAYPKGSP
jgi:alpha-L-arabinofuranosidase B-like protein